MLTDLSCGTKSNFDLVLLPTSKMLDADNGPVVNILETSRVLNMKDNSDKFESNHIQFMKRYL
jgi:hypothetical protein